MSGDALATGVCRYYDFEITLRATRTNKQFFGPFWRNEWVHDDTDEVRCWSPFASPIETLSADIAALVHAEPAR